MGPILIVLNNRVLRLLTAVGLFTEREGHRFTLTPLGAYLQTGVLGSMRNRVLYYGDQACWQVPGGGTATTYDILYSKGEP